MKQVGGASEIRANPPENDQFHSKYRPDIDGLRAISVIAVILYHYDVHLFSGGFVGVDVFFIISGYLITSHLYRDMSQGKFSIIEFYGKRFRRILPALFSVLIFSLFAGYFLLLPGDYLSLAWSSAYASLGLSNFYFLWNTSYFDQASDLMPLLHTWSLGVEEQFYLIWPILLMASVRFYRKSKFLSIMVLFVFLLGSFVASVYITKRSPSFAFYLLPTRAWELGLGAFIAFIPSIKDRLLSDIVGFFGLLAVLLGIFIISDEMPFPGAIALIPCIGAVMVVWPKSDSTVVRMLSWRPAVSVGLASYSAYLWHWPILVFYRFYNDGIRPNLSETAVLICITFLVSFFSYRYIERPFRTLTWSSRKVVLSGIGSSCALLLVGYGISMAGGFPQRLSEEVRGVSTFDIMWSWSDCRLGNPPGIDKPVCYFGADWETSKQRIFLWGDSHAEHFAPILNAAIGHQNISGILFNRCASAYGGSVNRYQPLLPNEVENCRRSYDTAVHFLQKHPEIDTVILAASWVDKLGQLYTTNPDDRSDAQGQKLLSDALVELVYRISAPNRKIVIVGPTPLWEVPNPVECYIATTGNLLRRKCSPENYSISAGHFRERSADEVAALKDAISKVPSINYISPSDAFCDDTSCITVVNGEFLYRDSGHLRRNLAQQTLSKLADRLRLRTFISEDL